MGVCGLWLEAGLSKDKREMNEKPDQQVDQQYNRRFNRRVNV